MKNLSIYLTAFICCTFVACQLDEELTLANDQRPSLADSLFQNALVLKDAYKTDSAILLFNQAKSLFHKSGNRKKIIACQRHTAFCFWLAHRSEEALSLCNQALEEAIPLLGEKNTEIAGIYIVMGNVHADRRTETDYRQCIAFYEKALAINQNLFGAQHPSIAEAYERLGIARYLIDDYAGALPFYEKASTSLGQSSDSTAIIQYKILGNLGLIYEGLGNFARSLESFEKSYQVLNQYNIRTTRTVKVLEYIARLHLRLGDIETALLTYAEAETMEKQVGQKNSKQPAYLLTGAGDCYFAKNDYLTARSFYEKCLPYWETGERDDVHGLLQELQKIGNCYLKEQQPEQASHFFRRAWETIDTIYDADSYQCCGPLLNLGQAEALAGNTRKALDYCRQALAIATQKAGDFHPITGEIKHRIAAIYFQANQLAEAEQWASGALKSYSGTATPFPPASTLKDLPACLDLAQLQGDILTKSFEKNGSVERLKKALNCYRYGIALSDSLKINYVARTSWADVQKKVASLSEKALYCIHQAWTMGNGTELPDEALFFFEKSRSALLLASLRENLAADFAGIPPHIRQKELLLQTQCSYYGQLLKNPPKEAGDFQIDIWKQRFFQSRHRLDSMVNSLEKHYPNYFRLKYDTEVATLSEVRDKAGKQHAKLLEYFWGNDAIYMLSIDSFEINLVKTSHPDTIRTLLVNLRKQLQPDRTTWKDDSHKQDEYRSFCKTSSKLYDLLVRPVRPDGLGSHLVISPDGPLNYLPFSVLLENQPDAAAAARMDWRKLPYLFRSMPMQWTPSATLWEEEYTGNGPSTYAGFAPVYEEADSPASIPPTSDSLNPGPAWTSVLRDERFQPLHFNQEEVEMAANLTDGKTFIKKQATETAFKKTADNAGILHFAMHALTNDADPMSSALIFTPDTSTPEDSYLYAWEIYNLRLKANLAVLSACNTGAGYFQKGEGVMSLARAFQFAGCASVLMSIWPANDASTKDLTFEFFNQLKQGESKSEALRQSQLKYLREVKIDEMTHPAYWANFVLTGNDAPLEFSPEKKWEKWWVLVLAGLMLGGWVLLKQSRGKLEKSR